MTWLTTTWLVIASACLTLAAIHAHVWLRYREAGANAAFAVLAASIAGMGYVELRMAHADTIDEFGRMLWWYHVPIWAGLVSAVLFVQRFLRAGRAWLGWTAIGLRTLALVVNAFATPSINYREITSLEKINLLGDPLSVVQGVPNPWLAVAQLSLVVLVAFVADAALDLWRRGERRRAVTSRDQGFQATKFARSLRPEMWLFSGWNWTAKILSRATAQVKGKPYTLNPATSSGVPASTK